MIPGHIFPLQAKDGGVIRTQGHTESSVDLARFAGFKPAAVLCEIMIKMERWRMANSLNHCQTTSTAICFSIDDIIAYSLCT